MQSKLLLSQLLRKTTCLLAAFFILCSGAFAQAGYVTNGSAYSNGTNEWVLTQNYGSQGGSVWYQNYMSLNANFELKFQVFLGYNDGGADGIAFVMQPNSTGAGSSGGGIGYQGIAPSIAVEFDTYQNDDPWYDHISVQRNGDVNYSGAVAGPVMAHAYNSNIEDGQWHDVRITWNAAAKIMEVYFDGQFRVSYNNDMVTNTFYGNPNVYWGFTGATGGASNLQMFRVTGATFTEAPSINITATNNTCAGQSNGTATATFSGGQAPYTFLGWNNGSMNTTITGLAAGTYTASMKDAAGTHTSKSITITEPAALVASISGGMNCGSGIIGFLDVSVSGGTPGYTYALNGGAATYSGRFDNLGAGTHTVIVTDAAGCSQAVSKTLSNTTPLVLSAAVTNGNGQCNGSVVLTPSGGSAPYVFNEFEESFDGTQINNNNVETVNGGFLQNNTLLAAQTGSTNYWNNGIFSKNTFTRTTGKSFEGSFRNTGEGYFMVGWYDASVDISQAQYYNMAHAIYFYGNGYGAIYENGSDMAYFNVPFNTTDWNDYKIELTATGANYYLRATGTTTWTLIASTNSYNLPTDLKVGVTYFTYPYYYYGGFETDNWKIGGNAATTNLCAGTYTYSVTDAAGCTASTTVTITDYVPVTSSFTVADANCNAAANGSINVTADKGTAPYTYSIDGGNTYSSNNFFGGLLAGTYTVVVKDAIGTITAPQQAIIAQPAPVQVSVVASGATNFCPGGNVTLTASGADNFSWSNGATTASITVNSTGNYTVSGTTNGCSSNAVTTAITVEDKIFPSITAPAAITAGICNQVSLGVPVVSDNCSVTLISNDAPGTFPVGTTIVTWTVEDAGGNKTTATQSVTIVAAPVPVIAITRTNTTNTGLPANTIALGYGAQNLTLTATAANATYSWSNGAQTAATTVAPVTTTSYTVTAKDAYGCTATTSATVNVVDVRCGTKNDKVLVCHPTGSASNPFVQICIASAAVPAELAKGAYLGVCAGATVSRDAATENAVVSANELRAFPNPSRGIVQLRLKNFSAGKVQVQVLDANGSAIRSLQHTVGYSVEDISLDLSRVAAGTYTIKVTSAGTIRYTRVVIAR
jgi:hypothetical protein